MYYSHGLKVEIDYETCENSILLKTSISETFPKIIYIRIFLFLFLKVVDMGFACDVIVTQSPFGKGFDMAIPVQVRQTLLEST